ncbi:MAG: hypothetical protein M0R74_15565 [Dehalococcoidia bacterium]|jgi:hypothetical protein|nr:hypothetical protein [Dehalococcoidia bacterium]
MILKIETSSGWVFYDEIDCLSYRNFPSGEYDAETDLKELIDHTEGWAKPCLENQKRLISFMNKNQSEESFVVAYSPIYLLNNEGKTIERI